MKIAKSQDHNKKEWVSILLESIADVLIYYSIHNTISSKQAINFWKEIKVSSAHDVSHGLEGYSDGIIDFMMVEIQLGKPITSIFDYANRVDKMIFEAHKMMLEEVQEGKIVRVNRRGGFCGITPDELIEYYGQRDINEQELFNYLLHEEIEIDFRIKKSALVFENGKYLPTDVIKLVTQKHNIDTDNIQVITDLKVKTLLFTESDWFNFFNEGIKNGLDTIIFETTAQDKNQIIKLKTLLENIPSLQHITIYIYTYYNSTAKEFIQSLEYDKNKIELIILEK